MRVGLLGTCLGGVALSLFLCLPVLSAQPKFKNNNQKFRPLTLAEEKKLEPVKLGQPPELTEKEQKRIEKGRIVTHKIAEKTFRAIGIVNAPPAKLMAFMKDYPARAGKMPHITKMRAIWNKNMAIVDQTMKVALSTFEYRLSFLHYGNSYIEWEYVEGDVRDTHGYWKFFPQDNGKKTLVVQQITTDPGIPMPKSIYTLLTKHSLPKAIKALRKAVVN